MRNSNKSTEKQELFKEYRSPRGMSLAVGNAPEERFRYLQNMYIDYGSDALLQSIPGYRRIHRGLNKIHSFRVQTRDNEKSFIIHEEGGLYRLPYPTGKAEKIAEIGDRESKIFTLGEGHAITDGQRLYLLEGDSLTLLCEESFITGCNALALFDGRLFLSGNKAHRGKIFYSTRLDEGVVFSEDNYLKTDGDTLALLSHGGRLWVFGAADEGGAISCHRAERGYPADLILSGVKPTGQVCSCEGEIMLLATDGLWSIDTTESEARLVRRSADVEPMLAREDIHSARLVAWKGYTAIGCGEHIYLLDRRGGGWYFLSDIGAHSGDRQIFRYSPESDEGYFTHKHTHGEAESEVISLTLEDGRRVYYTEEKGKKYPVYPTDERGGGELLPAENLLSDGELLCFSADGGLFIFNSDMQDSLAKKYSFDGHAADYVIVTEADNCGLPMTEKTSMGESLSLKIRAERKTTLTVSILTDGSLASRQKIVLLPAASEPTWADAYSRIALAERAHGWLEKQIVIEGGEFASPIALYSLAFKYLPKEKLKKG